MSAGRAASGPVLHCGRSTAPFANGATDMQTSRALNFAISDQDVSRVRNGPETIKTFTSEIASISKCADDVRLPRSERELSEGPAGGRVQAPKCNLQRIQEPGRRACRTNASART